MIQINNLNWYKLNIKFKSNESNKIKFLVINSIIKNVYNAVYPEYEWEQDNAPKVLFHVIGKKWNYKLNRNEIFYIEIIFVRLDYEKVKIFSYYLSEYMKNKNNSKYYEMIDVENIELRNIDILKKEYNEMVTNNEICLEFLTPYSFNPEKGKDKVYITKNKFIENMENWLSTIFQEKITYISSKDNFYLMPIYWDFISDNVFDSQTNKDGKMMLTGCVGKLYLKGIFDDFLDFLIICSELNLKSGSSYGRGHYYIHKNTIGNYNRFFPNKNAIYHIIQETTEQYDDVYQSLDKGMDKPFDEMELANDICSKIKNETYEFTPNKAFFINDNRIIEEQCFNDKIISRYILKTIEKQFDRIMEDEAVGFRKNRSIPKTIEILKEYINEGFHYILKTDIENFFHTIDIQKLKKLFEYYLPQNDGLIKNLIFKIIDKGYFLNNIYHKREKGIAQGDPLSPMMANLYLDDFDEYIKEFEVKFARYADDFIILSKTEESIIEMLNEAKEYLEEKGLKLKESKTVITNAEDGFQFLGYEFKGNEIIELEDTAKKIYKKVLYINEPYIFLALSGDRIDIMKDNKISASYPLQRISEIIIMNKVSFSSALISKCNTLRIPVTFTLESGYFLSTLKPDSKEYFNICGRHLLRYEELSLSEKLHYAKEFAAGKIDGFIDFFSKKYKVGNDLLIKKLEEYIVKIYHASTVEEIRGYEGISSKEIFKKLNDYINRNEFKFNRRDRDEPDFMNGLFNFGFYLLFTRINSLVRSMGLNPYLGFLHSEKDRYESLVCDIEEIFRGEIIHCLLNMVNLGIIRTDDFTDSKEQKKYLTKNGKHKFLNYYESYLEKKKKKEMSLKEKIYLQVHSFKNWVEGEKTIKFFRWR